MNNSDSHHMKQHHTPRYYAHRVKESLTTRVSKLICSVFLALLACIGIVLFILWLSLRPHRPRIFIEDFSIAGLAEQAGFENAQIIFNVTARNSNQAIGFNYDAMRVAVVYQDQSIGGESLLVPFYQSPKNTTILSGVLSGATLTVTNQRWKQFQGDRSRGLVLFKIYWWCFQVMAVWTVTALVIWRSLIPSCPTFTVADLHILASGINNSTFDHNTSFHNSSIMLGIQIFNPNKGTSIYYSDLYITVNYSGITVARNSTPGFYQTHKNNTTREVLMRAELPQFKQQIRGGNVTFKIGLETTVQYEILKWKTKHHRLHYEAYVHNVTISPNETE